MGWSRQFISGLFIVRLHSCQIVVRIGVVDNVRLPAVLLFNALFGQPAFHFKQLALPLGQLRNIDQHLVDRHTKAVHDLRRVEAVDGVLKSADRSLQFFKTRLCFCVIIGGTHRFNVLAHRRAEIPAALFFIQ